MAGDLTKLFKMARAGLATLRAHPALNKSARLELRQDLSSRHPVDTVHQPHLSAAVEWLVRAQDVTGTGGIARGYSAAWNPYFQARGWQAAYPETTGYIIPTFFEAAHRFGRSDLSDRAVRAADWEIEVQLESGAVQGGVIGQSREPAVFNTGQVILGWLAAYEATGHDRFAAAARRAGEYLVSVLEPDGHWRKGNSIYARGDATLYNARVAWALAEAGLVLDESGFRDAARKNLRAVARAQTANGWFPNCCLNDPKRPLLHTVAYTIRGLVDGGFALREEEAIAAGIKAADALLTKVRADGWLSGRFDAQWNNATSWSCLTGDLQMCNNWMRLFHHTGDRRWLEPVPRVLAFVKSTQNRTTKQLGLRGGIKGSWPFDGGYGRFEILNWATKYFVDALMRHEAIQNGRFGERAPKHRLA